MTSVLFLSAPLKERIWGGDYFNRVLHKTDSTEKIGEMWSLSAHPEGESVVLLGEFKGMKLSEVYKNYPDCFGNPVSKEFPILVKLIATTDDLSVQVHPNDEYARKYENQLGKTEGWLILDSNNSQIVIGHNAKNKDELKEYIANDDYKHLLNYRTVEKGEFYPIYSGTIHALGKNLLILEIQQSSDVTYRVYDYHRKDKNGNERQLHVQKAIDVTTYDNKINNPVNYFKNNQVEQTIWDNQYFSVQLVNVNNEYVVKKNFNYAIVSVCEGTVEVDGQKVSLGESFIITNYAKDVCIKGNGKVTITISKL